MTLSPVGDRILIRIDEAPSQTPGGIVLPDQARKSSTQGTVVAAGPGLRADNGFRQSLDVEEGDRVIFLKHAGVEVEFGGEKLLAMSESELIAVIREEA